MITAKDDEQYDESSMVAGMEQDFERLIEEKNKRIQYLENENDMLKDEIKVVKEDFNSLVKSVRRGIKQTVLGML